ncbi:MAG TPA: hypothetical protein VKR60_13870 [Candidatus Sulfotelmatobacter sp.]|nr:hypothetical protein [Candidatus Sulfotelmatobacter sp.]
MEIFGGYSTAQKDFTGDCLEFCNVRLSRGWNASANLKLNRFSQVVADFGGYYFHHDQGSVYCFGVSGACSSSVHTVLFGPQVSLGLHKLTPFAHVLLGTALANQNGTGANFQQNHAFTMALGGGADYGFTRYLALRAQADYLLTNFKFVDNQVSFANSNGRISAGLAVRF